MILFFFLVIGELHMLSLPTEFLSAAEPPRVLQWFWLQGVQRGEGLVGNSRHKPVSLLEGISLLIRLESY